VSIENQALLPQASAPDSSPVARASLSPKEPASAAEVSDAPDSKAVVTFDEKQVILWAVNNTYGDQHSELGPRTLRALLFRYQLARLILDQLNHRTWSPALLAKMITNKMFTGTIDFTPSTDDERIIKAVAEQVA
jgi:hypothetical protein